ncbi:GNAT family N-acetyltransferase [Bifidobacterium biavatii]|uniref:Acetyltransferase n=1 Tax=Bifidobacterium biavatii DSM 23969 TaxID=1437608 RepID=A0A087A0H7_9BIFI|nr:GNAT family N-acetyltransferase [Bifidobacterium biavatii]KFI52277.1 acetyltransferase [Bifidobacterium biavatii DSM 23969]
MALTLIEPTLADEDTVMAFRAEFIKRGERVSGGRGLEQADDYRRWLAGTYPPHYGTVKEAVYLAVETTAIPAASAGGRSLADRSRSEGTGRVVGISDLRLETNDFIDRFAGRIGYSVRPSARGRGYANEILRLTLLKAREFGFDRILITCNQPNAVSAKVIERNHGVLESVVPHPGFPDVRRYWIDLNAFDQ